MKDVGWSLGGVVCFEEWAQAVTKSEHPGNITGLQGLCKFLSMPWIKSEHLPLHSPLGHGIQPQPVRFFKPYRSFPLFLARYHRHPAGHSSYRTSAAQSGTERETNHGCVLRRPTFTSIHRDPEELLHRQTYPVRLSTVKHGDFHHCAPMPCNSSTTGNFVDGKSHTKHHLAPKHPWLITAGIWKEFWNLCYAKRHQHNENFRGETP